MPATVPRHEIPVDEAARRAERLVANAERKIASLEESPRSFGRVFSTSLAAACTYCGADPRAALLPAWEAFVTAMQVGSALFKAATASEEAVQCRIARKMRTVPATGPAHFTDAGSWLTAFFLAIICREPGRMTELAQVPVSLLRESGAEYDEYIYAWVDTLQTWWLRGGEIGDKLVKAMNGTDPEHLQIADAELMLKILYPPINLFYRYVVRDQEAFNSELAAALQWYKEYWTEHDGRIIDASGWVALELLAMACLAYDAGFPVEVDSEYLPKHLLERSWVGEFDT